MVAVSHTNYKKEIRDGKSLTMFAPNQDAWERLGLKNLAYLFGCEEGKKDLKKIVEYHVSTRTPAVTIFT